MLLTRTLALGHLDTGFFGFPLSLSKCWDCSQVPSCYCMLLMQPSLGKFIKIIPCCRATKLVNFKIISTLSNESWKKILPSLSQASTTHHPNVFTPILSLSEGRAGITWVPSNKMLFSPLRHKAPLAFPQMFSVYFYSYTILSDSLSLSLALDGASGQRYAPAALYPQGKDQLYRRLGGL
jgi:hypothetical protein